jgi:uncharacterized membrane protein YhaH (DUF805 family)
MGGLRLFFSPNGRINRRTFWGGFAVFLVAEVVLKLTPVGTLLSVVLLYPGVRLYTKRLHDFGRSGWLVTVPIAGAAICFALAALLGGEAFFEALAGGPPSRDAPWAIILGLITASGVIGTAFLVWVGLKRGDEGQNRFGFAPSRARRSP